MKELHSFCAPQSTFFFISMKRAQLKILTRKYISRKSLHSASIDMEITVRTENVSRRFVRA
jgi:hypothetical protein